MHSYTPRLGVLAGLSILIAACSNSSPSAPVVPTTTTFGGQSTVVTANVPGIAGDAIVGMTGMLPTSGGALETAQASAAIPGLLDADELHASAVGQGNISSSEASAANVHITIGGNIIKADFVLARATAQCMSGAPLTSGQSEIDLLTINGVLVNVTGAANQTITLPTGGQVILNEQTTSPGSITVTAIHVTIPGVGDVTVATAHAEIVCGTGCPVNNGDFVTGGGWIMVGGAKATFAVSGGTMNGTFWGDLEYNDHGANIKVNGSGVTGYTIVDATTRRITGNADINGVAGTYTVTVSDNGEPGRNDTFDLSLSTGYTASGSLGGGNIQLHLKPQCP
jgi:hypothetical protein